MFLLLMSLWYVNGCRDSSDVIDVSVLPWLSHCSVAVCVYVLGTWIVYEVVHFCFFTCLRLSFYSMSCHSLLHCC